MLLPRTHIQIAVRCLPKAVPHYVPGGDGAGGAHVQEPDVVQVGWGKEWILRALAAVTHEGVRLSTGKTLPRHLVSLLISWAAPSPSPYTHPSPFVIAASAAGEGGSAGVVVGAAVASSGVGRGSSSRVRGMVARVLGDLLCGRPPNDTDAHHRAWNERLASSEVPKLVSAMLDMVCQESNSSATTVHVQRLLARLARNSPQPWSLSPLLARC